MIFLERFLLISFCSIIFVCNLLASEINFQYEKKTIKQHCDIIFKLSNNQSFYDLWQITKIDDLTDEYFNKVQIGDIVKVLPVHSCMSADLMKRFLTTEGEWIDAMQLKHL